MLKICKRSGLAFETEGRKTVHPGISLWATHKDYDIRRAACDVIDRGKQEGWETLEKFEAEIEKALNPPDPKGVIVELRQASRVGSFKKPWIARITGQSSSYGYSRNFLIPFETEKGGQWRFLIEEDGVYEACDRNSKGDERRSWLRVQSGQQEYLTKDEVIAIIGEPAEVKRVVGLSSGLPFATSDEDAVEECLGCGARYRENGYVEYGGMGCRYCD
ncbi:MAG TPA: hypothetical protein V6D29_11175 [Leptolyngbyaceae cyanobacterium]